MRTALAFLLLLAIAFAAPLGPAPSAWAQGCLSAPEQEEAIRSGRVVRPGQLGRQLGGEVLRIQLCRGNGGLVWNVTVLGGDGRVVSRTVDARTGRVLR